jgi:hypothetical protein
MILAACSSPTAQDTPGASSGAETTPTGTSAPSGESATPGPSSISTPVPATAAASPTLAVGFQYSDILKVQVNRLAARVTPDRNARLVHGYNVSGPAPVDAGEIRLSKGDYVSVQLGPVPVGDTVWYLVWPAKGGHLHVSDADWYQTPPMAGQAGPGWVAASVGAAKYMTFFRKPSVAEVEAWEAVGLNAAALGSYQSAPMPRHDAFQFSWAAAAPVSGTACQFKVELVPDDSDFDPLVAVDTSTTTAKVAPLNGAGLPWTVAGSSTWDTFTLNVTSTCNWAVRLLRLEHD